MRVTVDAGRCQGHALCVLFGPDMFVLDEHGHALVDADEVPAVMEAAVRAAAARCPEQAIRVTSEPHT